MVTLHELIFFFFFNDTATTEIYTLSLHDALPILIAAILFYGVAVVIRVLDIHRGLLYFVVGACAWVALLKAQDRKSTRLNSSHGYITYAVFCLKKKTTTHSMQLPQPRSQPQTATG